MFAKAPIPVVAAVSFGIALLATVPAVASDKLFSFEQVGKLSSGSEFSVKITESAYVRRPTELPDDGSWWGIDGGFPLTYCTTFDITINGTHVNPVRKLYQDLTHLNEVKVSEENGQLLVLVSGGDAAGSFDARFLFREFEVERIVRHGEVPNSVWERTVYHNSALVDTD